MVSRIAVPDVASAALNEFLTITSLPIQWGDQDAFGHVNNVVYFRWFESARIDLLDQFPSSVSMSGKSLGPILASMHCDYLRQLRFADTVHIGSKIGRIGRSSLEVQHAVFSEHWQGIAARATSVLVIFDYDNNRPTRIPDDLRHQFEQAATSSSE